MANVRKKMTEILASKPIVNHAHFDATTDDMIAKQRLSEGYAVDLEGTWKRVDNRVKSKKLEAVVGKQNMSLDILPVKIEGKANISLNVTGKDIK